MKNRRAFLKDVCPTVAFAFFGLNFLEACSSDDDTTTSSPGFTKNGNTYSIDLTHSNFSNISAVGGWMNGHSIGIPALFLRISNAEIQAYTNVCPHNGNNNNWTYLAGDKKFRCNYHGYQYSSDNCTSGPLSCYYPTIDDNTLTLTIS